MNLKEKLEDLRDADTTTYEHSVRCGNYLAMLAKSMGKDMITQQLYREAGYAHDMGKLSVMKYVKSNVNIRELSPEEAKGYKDALARHVGFADEHLRALTDWKQEYSDAANYHHCHYASQKGYSAETVRGEQERTPNGNQIPEVAQMLAVVDVYDALTDPNRPYRNGAMPDEKVREIMDKVLEEGQFNPKMAKTFMQDVVPKIKEMSNDEKLKVDITSPEKEDMLRAFGIERSGYSYSHGTNTHTHPQRQTQVRGGFRCSLPCFFPTWTYNKVKGTTWYISGRQRIGTTAHGFG